MKYLTLLILPFLIGCGTDSTTNRQTLQATAIDTTALRQELDSMYELDQKYRSQMMHVYQEHGWNSPEMNELWSKQSEIDSANLIRVQQIIDETGTYPGISLLGYSSSKNVFYILQHAPDSIQNKYYPLIAEAGKNNELDKRPVAMYTDRYLMQNGEPQIYGSQLRSQFGVDPTTGERMERMVLWPIADTTNIDSLRQVNGLGSLEEYLNKFGLSRWE